MARASAAWSVTSSSTRAKRVSVTPGGAFAARSCPSIPPAPSRSTRTLSPLRQVQGSGRAVRLRDHPLPPSGVLQVPHDSVGETVVWYLEHPTWWERVVTEAYRAAAALYLAERA